MVYSDKLIDREEFDVGRAIQPWGARARAAARENEGNFVKSAERISACAGSSGELSATQVASHDDFRP